MSIYSLLVLLALVGVATSLSLILYSLQNRHWRSSRSFALWMFGGLIWVASVCLSALSTTPEQAIFWVGSVRYVGITIGTSMLAIFALDYTGRWHQISKPFKILLIIMPVITTVIALTPGHQLLWHGTNAIRLDGYWFAQGGQVGLWYWVIVFFGYGVAAYGLLLLIMRAMSGFAIYRWRTLLLVGGTLLPIMASLWMTIQGSDRVHIDVAAITITIVGPMWGWMLFRGRLLDVLPIAHDKIIDHVQDIVIVVDTQGKVVELNPTGFSFLNKPTSTVLNHPVTHAFNDYPTVVRHLESLEDTSTDVQITIDERDCYYKLRVVPLYLREDHLIGYLITLHDITDRHLSEQKRVELAIERQRVEVLRTFIRDASHDFRTPLTTINTSLFLLQKELGGIGQNRLDIVQEQIDRLANLVEDMLFMVRLDEQSDILLNTSDLNDVVSYAIEAVRKKHPHYELKIDYTDDKNLPKIPIDPKLMTRAFRELLSNAVVHSMSQSDITIKAFTEKERIIIEVSDEGVGIDEKEQLQIFQRFYRGDTARGTNTGGAGLGLPITQRIIDLHCGSIQVESNVNQGSTFRVTLPVSEPVNE